MSEAHSEEHLEAVRTSKIQVGISRTIDKLAFRHAPDLTRVAVVDEIIKKVKADGGELSLSSENDNWVVLKDRAGNMLDLTEVVSDALLFDKRLVDQDSVVQAVSDGKLGAACKTDLRDVKAKLAYMARFGCDAYDALPLHRAPKFDRNPDTMTKAQYLSLSRTERAHLGFTPEQTAEIMDRK